MMNQAMGCVVKQSHGCVHRLGAQEGRAIPRALVPFYRQIVLPAVGTAWVEVRSPGRPIPCAVVPFGDRPSRMWGEEVLMNQCH